MTEAAQPATRSARHAERTQDESTDELVEQLVEQAGTLVRDELRHAQAEYRDQARHAATGVGMLGAGGLLALHGLGALVAAVVLGLSAVLPAWFAALLVSAVLLASAALVSLSGRRRVAHATPERTLDGRTDVDGATPDDAPDGQESGHQDGIEPTSPSREWGWALDPRAVLARRRRRSGQVTRSS